MRIAGTRDLQAPPEQVWAALTDPEVLTIAVPGCESAAVDPAVRLRLGWRLAGLEGVYVAGVDVLDAVPPETATLRVTAQGEPGMLTGTVTARLEADGAGTRLEWEADYDAGAGLAVVGGRVLEAALRRQADGLLDGVARHLGGPRDAPAPPRPSDRRAAPPRPAPWGPFEDGPVSNTERLVVAAVAGALLALVLVRLGRRLRM